METKAGIDILLLEEESKHGEREQEVELQHGIVQPVSGVLNTVPGTLPVV